MQPLKIHEKQSGGWWVTKAKEEPKEASPRSPVKHRSMSNLLSSRTDMAKTEQPPVPVRSNTTFFPTRSNTITRSNTVTIKKLPPTPSRSATTNLTVSVVKSPATKAEEDKTIDTSKQYVSSSWRCHSDHGLILAITTEVPAWLLNACSALDLLTTEHPKVMTTLSAILITVGSIPAIPAIAGGAGGAILASGAAHAVGAVAVGVGSWIKLQQDTKQRALAVTNNAESGTSK